MKKTSKSGNRRPRKRGAGGTQPDVAAMLVQAIELLRDEQIEQAEQALNEVLAAAPQQPDALHFLGVLRHTQGRVDEAVALIRQTLAQLSDHAGAWNNLGNVLLGAGRIGEATEAYEHGVRVASGSAASADALNNLGTVYRRQGRLAEAEAACRRAIDARSDFGDAWYNLSQVLIAQGKLHEGLLANSRAIAVWPRHLQARDQFIRALLLLGERERAAQLYREWLAEEPDNPLAQHQLAACLGESQPERASDAYIQKLFDNFAASFDAKLEKLDYRAPELVTEALRLAVGEPRAALRIVDAGCGTGLCGPLVKPWANHLSGCDLSVGMLRRARERRAYDALHHAELVYYLDTQPAAFDAVISADTLCYFGPLAAAFAAAKHCLRSGGWLVFTVEALPDTSTEDHRLQLNGRYAHASEYLRSTLREAGMALRDMRSETLRMEAGLPVNGWLVTARNA
jgi:predicted TPR repeat methyltransferase